MFEAGQVYRYSYVWSVQFDAGEESGRKDRPVCLLLGANQRSGPLFLFPITTAKPEAGRAFVEIAAKERRSAGLDRSCWLIIDEYNRTSADTPYDFVSLRPMGRLSPAFLTEVALQIRRLAAQTRIRAVNRT